MFYPLKPAGRVDRAAQIYEDDTLQTKAALLRRVGLSSSMTI